MKLAPDTIDAMIEGLARVKRIPQKEWLDPIIQLLLLLRKGEIAAIKIEKLNF